MALREHLLSPEGLAGQSGCDAVGWSIDRARRAHGCLAMQGWRDDERSAMPSPAQHPVSGLKTLQGQGFLQAGPNTASGTTLPAPSPVQFLAGAGLPHPLGV